ncbi:MAG: hypothetical protein ACO1Q7_15240 [Gemmatimonas sp.]
MKLRNALFLAGAAAGMLIADSASAQDARPIQLRFRKAGDSTVVIKGAEVRIDHEIDLVTDSMGIAHVPMIDDGGHIVEVVAKGYQAFFTNFVSGDFKMPIDLELRAYVPPAKPKGEDTKLTAAEFDKRRALAGGKFFTPAQMKAAEGRPLSNFLKVDAGAKIVAGPNNESFMAAASSTAASPCYAAVVRDGLKVYPFETATPPDLDKIFTDNVSSVELYATAPASLGVTSKCGVLVIWSK